MPQRYNLKDRELAGNEGTYKLTKFIASGSFADVWEGVKEDRQQFALKIIPVAGQFEGVRSEEGIFDAWEYVEEYMQDRDRHPLLPKEQYENEKNAWDDATSNEEKTNIVVQQSNDPRKKNILPFYECFGYTDPRTNISFKALVLKYAPFGDLFSALKGRTHTEETVAKIMKPIYEGVAFLHDLKIYLNDIKRENILFLTNDLSYPVISDLGGAINCNDFKTQAVPLKDIINYPWTPELRAPELIHQDPESKMTGKADVFSTTMTCLELLLGGSPFEGADAEAVVKGRQTNVIDFKKCAGWDRITRQGRDFILKGTATDPDDRMGVKVALKHSWWKLIGNRNAPESFRSPLDVNIVADRKHHHQTFIKWATDHRTKMQKLVLACVQTIRHQRKSKSSIQKTASRHGTNKNNDVKKSANAETKNTLNK